MEQIKDIVERHPENVFIIIFSDVLEKKSIELIKIQCVFIIW